MCDGGYSDAGASDAAVNSSASDFYEATETSELYDGADEADSSDELYAESDSGSSDELYTDFDAPEVTCNESAEEFSYDNPEEMPYEIDNGDNSDEGEIDGDKKESQEEETSDDELEEETRESETDPEHEETSEEMADDEIETNNNEDSDKNNSDDSSDDAEDEAVREEISEKSEYSDEVNDHISSVEELEVYQKAGLREEIVDGRTCLVRSDVDLDYVDPKTGMTNRELMEKGRAPRDAKTGETIELHHIGQDYDSPLAELTADSEHGDLYSTLHTKDSESWRQDEKKANHYNVQRNNHWKQRAKGD